MGSNTQYTLLGHTDAVSSLNFSRDGKQLVSASLDKTVRVWDLRNGTPLRSPLETEVGLWSAEFSPSGNRLFAAGNQGLSIVWDVNSGKVVESEKSQGIYAACLSQDGLSFARFGNGIHVAEARRASPESIAAGETNSLAIEAIIKIEKDFPLKTQRIDSLQRLDGLTSEVRNAAIALAERLGDSPYHLFVYGWEILRQSQLSVEDYQLAAELLHKATELVPECRDYELGLALSKYRLGLYTEALDMLQTVESRPDAYQLVHGKHWSQFINVSGNTLLVRAMAEFQLGQKESAQKHLILAKNFVEDTKILAEATRLIGESIN